MKDDVRLTAKTPIEKIVKFSLENRLVVSIALILIIFWGLVDAPFDWNLPGISSKPVPVDAIPDISENQQIVFADWEGRSPQDVEDQITYPLTAALIGIPGIKTIRSNSMFGFSIIYIIFNDDVDFYFARTRLLEKLNSLPVDILPEGVEPVLGPDATPLGQVFWYMLEGRDPKGNVAGGWDLQELRSVQDWYIRYQLQTSEGISEVASIGGYVKEYQVDVDPDAMRAAKVSILDVANAVRMSNIDVGAKTIEVNGVEYIIRGKGFVKSAEDLENSVIKVQNGIPIFVKNVAKVSLGPAFRTGVLDKGGTEVVGGVAVVRYGENPLEAIKNVKKKIAEINDSLPSKTLPDGTPSRITIVPFYDRTGLIHETLDTLNSALTEEVLVTIIVILLMLFHFSSAVLVSSLLPLSVLATFALMKMFNIDANIVSLAGIAIAIGEISDMGIVLNENIIRRMAKARPGENPVNTIYKASTEVGGAVVTAILTTIVGFLPVFAMTGPEGKLFKPLAYTKTFALIASLVLSITVVPALNTLIFRKNSKNRKALSQAGIFAVLAGFAVFVVFTWWLGIIIIMVGLYRIFEKKISTTIRQKIPFISIAIASLIILLILASRWMLLGIEKGLVLNFFFVLILMGGILVLFELFRRKYDKLLLWALKNRRKFLAIPVVIAFFGLLIWQGFNTLFAWLPAGIRTSPPVSFIAHKFPGLGKEFMPPLDEGSFLYMPTAMPHASIGEMIDILHKQDMAISSIPEVESSVGKIGRVESALDPAPISMVETVINYKSKYILDENGERALFKYDDNETDFFRSPEGLPLNAPDGEPYKVSVKFIRDKNNKLIHDKNGMPFRLWRAALDVNINPGREEWKGIEKPDDIWDVINSIAQIPGMTSAPKLQPINARIVMLQSGMRAAMGIKIKGPDLATIEKSGLKLEELLKHVPSVNPDTVIADRVVGKPYLEIEIDRQAAARYGVMTEEIQDIIEMAIGGKALTTTVEGRERYPVRIRYQRELRDSFESIGRILVPTAEGAQVPLELVAHINYVRGPEMIKSEDTFLTGYVLFDKNPGWTEVDVIDQVKNYLQQKKTNGEFSLPGGVSISFAGTYENQVHAVEKLRIILPVALVIIFIILYFNFKSVIITLFIFSGLFVAWSGGFIMIWLYNQPWFMDFSLFGVNMREVFQIHPVNLSVAVWVGFLALFGIATDDGVLVATYIRDLYRRNNPKTRQEIRETTIEAGKRRVRPALMTTATTILALIPILTSSGRGSDIMIPMAIPSFGGMVIAIITILVVPVLYSAWYERMMEK